MVRVYITNVENLPDPLEAPQIMQGFSDERKEKALKFKQVKDRKESLGAGLLLLKVLKMQGKSIEDIYYGENGKPELDGLHFNLSHSHNMVALAVSEQPVGIDLEIIDKIHGNIAKRYFTERENAYLDAFEGAEREKEFFRIWTMKESYLKMTGEGLSLELNRVDFVIGDKVTVYRDGKCCECFVKEYEVPGYKLTVCAEEEDVADVVKYVDILE